MWISRLCQIGEGREGIETEVISSGNKGLEMIESDKEGDEWDQIRMGYCNFQMGIVGGRGLKGKEPIGGGEINWVTGAGGVDGCA